MRSQFSRMQVWFFMTQNRSHASRIPNTYLSEESSEVDGGFAHIVIHQYLFAPHLRDKESVVKGLDGSSTHISRPMINAQAGLGGGIAVYA